MFPRLLALILLAVTATAADVKPIPPPGIPVPDADRAALTASVAALGKEIDSLKIALKAKPEMLALLPDVMIFHKAADWALRYDEFFNPKHIDAAKAQLELGMQRARELRDGKPSWNSATGLVVRGYISKIDGSVQPYGLVIPDDWKPDEKTPRRLDFWFRGRSEQSTELAFIADRMKNKGEFTPPGAIVLHPFGRYCCANKFAGETDLFEALENAKLHYKIADNRMSVRGFSMGGASAWQFGTHFAGLWIVVAPGAGFGETAEFCRVLGPGKTPPPPWEQTLWRWYDSTDYVSNLANTTTVAYSGEIDGQKQAADIMIRYARKEAGNANPPASELNKVAAGDGSPSAADARVTGTAPDLEFYHVIGPQTPHKIKAEAKPEIDQLVDAAVWKNAKRRREEEPRKIHLTTYTLIYNKMGWAEILKMEKQWERADLDGELTTNGIILKTKNVSALWLQFITMKIPPDVPWRVTIDGTTLPPLNTKGVDDVLAVYAAKRGGKWILNPEPSSSRFSKIANICGPIDHAFMSSFLFVRPTGKPLNDKVGAWTKAEMEHAIGFWRKVFRGDVRVKDDTALTAEDVAASNLILWGDPSSNTVLAKLLARLPLQWTRDKLTFAGQTYDAKEHAPVLIYPNPANPSRYIVLNSGPTFREEALLNNAQQVAKLPDWAIINLNTPPDARNPGEVVTAGFFDEQWKAPQK